MDVINLKILSDVECDVYVDNKYFVSAKSKQVEYIPLQKGEYWIQCVCISNTNYVIEQIVNIESHKVLKLDFIKLIDDTPELWNDSDVKFNELTKSYYHLITNKEITPRKYDKGWDFHKGIALVFIDCKCGIINIKGEEIVSCCIENCLSSIRPFDDSIFLKIDNKWGAIRKDGQEIVPFTYNECKRFGDNLVVKEEAGWGIINSLGHRLVKDTYDEYYEFGDNGLVKRNGKWGIVDNSGGVVIPCIYEEVNMNDFGYYNEWGHKRSSIFKGIIGVRNEDKWGIIGYHGREIIPLEYDAILHNEQEEFSKFIVKNGNKWGFCTICDSRISYETSCIFDECQFIQNCFLVKKENKWGVLGSDINTFPIEYDEWYCINSIYSVVKKNDTWAKIEMQTRPWRVIHIDEKEALHILESH